MSNYYSKQDAKVKIAHELMNRGWNVEGYHADESDMMTDYYCPAHWYGVATKNGFILVVDNDYEAKATEITKFNPAGNLSFEDKEKINKLENMTVEKGATEGEEQNAKKLIEKIQSKTIGKSQYEVIGYTTAHMGNPKGSIWHIEKDGKIYDKGNALTKFADVPESYEFDINKMEYIGSRKGWEVSEETKKIVNDFKALILRFERVVNGMNSCGDGTKETEQKAQEQQVKAGFEKVTVTETKEEIKINEIEKPTEIKDGMYFILKASFNHGCSKGTVYKINSVSENPYNHKFYIDANRMNRKLNKVLTGNATTANSFDVELEKLVNWIDKGSISIAELVTVSTPVEVEKWVKIDKTKKTYNSETKTEQPKTENQTVTEQTEQTSETVLNHEITITADTDTRDNSSLWVVKIVDKLNPEEYKKVAEQFKALKGYYSKFKHGFIFKYDPTSILKPETKTATEQQDEKVTEEVTEEVTETEKSYNDVAENIVDMSTEFITELNIEGSAIIENEAYKTKMYDYIKNRNINITDDIINYIKAEYGFDKLIEVLELIQSGYYKPIKDGFIYDCHFKEWDIPMNEIQDAITAMNISFIDMGDKIGFKGLTAEQTRQVKEISDINSSIFFIDFEIPISKGNSVTDKHSVNEGVTDNIIDMQDYKNNSEVDKMENVNPNSNSNDFNFDDILNQFDNIEINNNSRISKDDEEFCKVEQEQYTKAVDTLNSLKNIIQVNLDMDITANKPYSTEKSNNTYLGYYDFKELTKLFIDKKENFVYKIISYFTNKYKVTIDPYKVAEKYKNIDVDYNILLDEIFLQLGGYSFTEKAFNEVKTAIREKAYSSYDNKFRIEVKGSKIIFENIYVSWSETSKYDYIDGKRIYTPIVESGYRSGENFKPYIDAFSWFEYSRIEDVNAGLRNYQMRITPDEFKNGISVGNRVETIKFFKNGRMDVKFANSQLALQFAKEYCGYIEKAS